VSEHSVPLAAFGSRAPSATESLRPGRAATTRACAAVRISSISLRKGFTAVGLAGFRAKEPHVSRSGSGWERTAPARPPVALRLPDHDVHRDPVAFHPGWGLAQAERHDRFHHERPTCLRCPCSIWKRTAQTRCKSWTSESAAPGIATRWDR